VIYNISHVTTYRYETPVATARCAMRLLPRHGGGQCVIHANITLSPDAGEKHERTDFFGNRVVEARLEKPHVMLRLAMEARLCVDRDPPPAPGLTPCWERTRRAAAAVQSLGAESPAHWLFPSRLTPFHDPLTAYARESFPAKLPVLEGAIDLMRRIYRDFAYDPDATHVSTPLAQAFAARRGVCQDFAHIMIAGLRGIGLPAGYVSGYIRTIAADGQTRLEGADASHAWVRVWCGPELEWIDLDPTNALLIGNDHIVVAIGRDYAEVSPIDGVILGAGRQKLDVRVDVKASAGAS
jgi:transglutaminase-like putative cysteine protease